MTGEDAASSSEWAEPSKGWEASSKLSEWECLEARFWSIDEHGDADAYGRTVVLRATLPVYHRSLLCPRSRRSRRPPVRPLLSVFCSASAGQNATKLLLIHPSRRLNMFQALTKSVCELFPAVATCWDGVDSWSGFLARQQSASYVSSPTSSDVSNK